MMCDWERKKEEGGAYQRKPQRKELRIQANTNGNTRLGAE
jgi:hypothetical protein